MSREPTVAYPESTRPHGSPAIDVAWRTSLVRVSLLVGLFAVSARNFEFFHAVVELFCVGVAVAIVVYAWNARGLVRDTYASVLGIGYGWGALLDLVHTLAFPGMNVFGDLSTDHAIQVWLLARLIQVVTLLVAPLLAARRASFVLTWVAFGALSTGLFSLVLLGDVVPKAYDPVMGVTAFKTGFEVFLVLVLGAAWVLTRRARAHLEAETVRLMTWSIALTIVSELSLAFYRSPFSLASVGGHLLKVVAYYFAYRAILLRGSVRPFQALFRDVIEGRARFSAIFEHMLRPALVVVPAPGGDYLVRDANPAAALSLGRPVGQLLGAPCASLMGGQRAAAISAALDEAWHSGEAVSRSIVERGEGEVLESWIDHEVFRIPGDELVVVSRDRTDEMRGLEALRHTSEELRRLHDAQHRKLEEERRRIAQELHDELGQVATALTIGLDRVERRVATLDPTLTEPVAKLKGLASSTVDSIRRICSELRPSQLDLLGLPDAVEAKLRDFERETGIETSLVVDVDARVLDRDLSTALFRILQESLTNVARHSFAGAVAVRLAGDGVRIVLEVADDGRGITESEANAETAFGLIGMRERALSAGGQVTVAGSPDGGTRVRVEVPVNPVTVAP